MQLIKTSSIISCKLLFQQLIFAFGVFEEKGPFSRLILLERGGGANISGQPTKFTFCYAIFGLKGGKMPKMTQ